MDKQSTLRLTMMCEPVFGAIGGEIFPALLADAGSETETFWQGEVS